MAELKLDKPPELRESIRKLLDATPGVQYKQCGWFSPSLHVTGSPEVLEELKIRIAVLEGEYLLMESW